jgi:hypothetical protein
MKMNGGHEGQQPAPLPPMPQIDPLMEEHFVASPEPASGGLGARAYKDTAQRNKFVGRNRDSRATGEQEMLRQSVFLPPDIRRAAQMLGLSSSEITSDNVYRAWRKLICAPGAHPDSGGLTEGAIMLNTSKDDLLRWLEESAPKLGRQFFGPQK